MIQERQIAPKGRDIWPTGGWEDKAVHHERLGNFAGHCARPECSREFPRPVHSVKTTEDAMANIYILLRQGGLSCPRLEIRKDGFTVIFFTFHDAVEESHARTD